jgi:hypothetical protein
MTDAALLERARQLWTALAGTPVTFHAAGIDVAVSPQSLLCPPGWVGIVVLGDAAIATAPDDSAAELVRRALRGLPATAMTDPAAVRDRLPIGRTLGPATLAYCDPATFRPADPSTARTIPADRGTAGAIPAGPSTVETGPAGSSTVGTDPAGSGAVGAIPADLGAVETMPAGHPDMGTLLARVRPEDADEADLAEITSPAFVIRGGAGILAAAGYQVWPHDTAHLSVLTATAERGRGLARVAAGAAVASALAAGLLPQWRARPEASRRVARALGFKEFGSQLSLSLPPVAGPARQS